MLTRLLFAATLASAAFAVPAAAQTEPVSLTVGYTLNQDEPSTAIHSALNLFSSTAHPDRPAGASRTAPILADSARVDAALAHSAARTADGASDPAEARQISRLADRTLAGLAKGD